MLLVLHLADGCHHDCVGIRTPERVVFLVFLIGQVLGLYPQQKTLPQYSPHRVEPVHLPVPQHHHVPSHLLPLQVPLIHLVVLSRIIEILQAETKSGQPKKQVPFLWQVDIESPLLQDQRKALPSLQFEIALFAHGGGHLAINYSLDILEQI